MCVDRQCAARNGTSRGGMAARQSYREPVLGKHRKLSEVASGIVQSVSDQQTR